METLVKNNYVFTISQKTCLKRSCIRIREQFHEKDVDCFRINGKWISKHFNNIAIDEFTGTYNYITKLCKGVKKIDFDEQNKCYNVTYGYSSKPQGGSINVYGFKTPLLILNDDYYKELVQRLKPCRFSDIPYLDGLSNFKEVVPYDANRDNYDLTVSLRKAKLRKYSEEEMMNYGIISKSFKTSENKKYTFGVEIETSDGLLTSEQANELKLNIMTDKDGSVYSDKGKKYGGAEYITGVLQGDSGLRQLKILCRELSKKTLINETCSVHVHLGTDFDNLFILFMYILGNSIEKDMYSVVSKNRLYKPNGQMNDFCKPLKNINLKNITPNMTEDVYNKTIAENFKKVFSWISCGHDESERCNRLTNHPKGAKCGYDKETSRYCWINMVPTYFNTRNNKSYTIEFRMMGETTNYYKIKNWLLLCMSLVWFVENRRTDILNNCVTINNVQHPLTIFNILRVAYPTKGEMLANYFMKRAEFFSKNINASESAFLIDEINNDEEITLLNILKESNSICV